MNHLKGSAHIYLNLLRRTHGVDQSTSTTNHLSLCPPEGYI